MASTLLKEPYNPFPFFGDQIVLSSERIHLHAREDSVMMFARRSIGLSSLATLNFDCNEKVTINSPKIYLGLNAQEQLILGNTFIKELKHFAEYVNIAGNMLKSVGESQIGDAIAKVAIAGKFLFNSSQRLLDTLDSTLSIVSYTE